MVQGEFLRLYVLEKQSHQGVLLWEWLLDKANKLGIRGGSAFRTIGGFGRRHDLHESRFFDLAGHTGVEVEFIVTPDERKRLIELIQGEKVRVFYARIPVHFGVINPDADDPREVAVAG